MPAELEAELNLKEDQVLVVDMGADEREARDSMEIIGLALPDADRGVIVI